MASFKSVLRKYLFLLIIPLGVFLCVLLIPSKALHSPLFLSVVGVYSLFAWFSYFHVCVPNVPKSFSAPFYFLFLFSWVLFFSSLASNSITFSFRMYLMFLGVLVVFWTAVCFGVFSLILVRLSSDRPSRIDDICVQYFARRSSSETTNKKDDPFLSPFSLPTTPHGPAPLGEV
jgi:hypothetical protein